MTVQEIMTELQSKGSESIKQILLKHGVKEPFFGVKVEYLKPIQKAIKKDYQLAKDLYATGNADAMYLAGLIADDNKMTRSDLQTWVAQAVSDNINGFTVPWVAAEGKYGYELGMEWIGSANENIAAAGWATLSNVVALKADNELDIPALRALLKRVTETIHSAPNRIKKVMNAFVIALGSFVTSLTGEAIAASKEIGVLTIDMNGTACKVPDAAEYIIKIKNRGSLGKKKKTVKC